jgi:hypothetical protein
VDLVRGYMNANVQYAWFASKRRIGAFAVKGWISGRYYSTSATPCRSIDNLNTINPWFVSGFIDGEGYSTIAINRDSSSQNLDKIPWFLIGLIDGKGYFNINLTKKRIKFNG